MFHGLLGRKASSKCKSLLKMTKTRLQTVRKKRAAVQKYLKNDVADLLKNNLDYNAYGRAEGLLVEMNMTSCYELIQRFCDSITDHIADIYKGSECPEECKEAIPSLMFAAARISDLPELRDLRNLFSQKYGTSLDPFVNQEFVDRMKLKPPTKDMKIQLLLDVAQEFSIDWDCKALEQKMYTPPAPTQNLGSLNKMEDEADQWRKSKIRDVPVRSMEEDRQQKDQCGRETAVEPKKEEHEGRKKMPYNIVPPPYVINDKASHPEKNQINSPGEFSDDSPKPNDDAVTGTKSKPRSVRRRPLKPPPGYDNAGVTSPTGTGALRPNLRDEQENEDRNMDGTLDRHGSKQSSSEGQKSKPLLKPPPSMWTASSASENARPAMGDHPRRRSGSVIPSSKPPSFPSETGSPTEAGRGHTRTSSLQQEMNHGVHVHPKMPEYDDLAARLAALRAL